MFEKNGSQWVREQENTVDVEKTHISCHEISAVSFWQHEAENSLESK